MNKTRKILGGLIVVTLAVSSFSACGSNKDLEPAEVVTETPTPTATPEPTATPAPTATPVPEIANKTIYAIDNVNVRASASQDGEIVGSLTPGEGVTALENPKDGWIRIQLDGADGYVKEEFMSETAPEGAADTGSGTEAPAAAETTQTSDAGTAASGTVTSTNVDESGVPYGPSSNWTVHDTGNVDGQGAKIYADTGTVVNITENAITIQSDLDGETYVYAQSGLDMNNTSVGESATVFYYEDGSILEVQ